MISLLILLFIAAIGLYIHNQYKKNTLLKGRKFGKNESLISGLEIKDLKGSYKICAAIYLAIIALVVIDWLVFFPTYNLTMGGMSCSATMLLAAGKISHFTALLFSIIWIVLFLTLSIMALLKKRAAIVTSGVILILDTIIYFIFNDFVGLAYHAILITALIKFIPKGQLI